MAWPRPALMQRLGLTQPIIPAPMAGAAGPELAIAAIRAGALGPLPCAMLTPEEARAHVAEVRAAVAGPINLNFFCHVMPEAVDDSAWRDLLASYCAEFGVAPSDHAPARPRLPFGEAMCAVVEEVRPEAVSFHFGLPEPALLERVRATGAFIMASATTPREAGWLAERGVDAVIAQGLEAGGHASCFLDGGPGTGLGLMALLPQVADAVEVPVIAAGGIGDGRGIAAAMALGAGAVQMGTAFLHCPESRISPLHRAALAGEEAGHTQLTTLFTGRPARGITNRLMRELGALNPAAPVFPHAATALTPLRAAAEARGDPGFSPLWAGQAARLGRAVGAAELVALLAREAQDCLAAMAATNDGRDQL